MKKLRRIAFTARSRRKIPSINSTYKCKVAYSYGKPIGQMYVSKECRDWKADILEALRCIDFEKEAPWIFEKNRRFTLKLVFLIGSALNNSDVDNRIKATQDCLFKRLHMNDARILRVEAEKRLVYGASHETVCFELIENLDDPLFNNLESVPCPENILFRGFQPNSVLEGWLKERRYDLTEDSGVADCLISLVTKDSIGLSQVSEVLGEIQQIKLGETKASVFFGVVGEESDYQPEKYKELLECVDLVNRIGGGSKHIMAAVIPDQLSALKMFLSDNGWKGKRKKKVNF